MRRSSLVYGELGVPSSVIKANWLAMLLAAGGVVAVVDLALPSWTEGSEKVRLALAGVAFVASATVFLGRDRMGRHGQHVALLGGVAMVTAFVWNDARGPTLYADAMFYGWVLALAFAFHRLEVALRYVALVAIALAAALASHWQAEMVTAWIIVMLALCVPAVVTGYLFAQTQRLAMQDALTGLFNRRAFLVLLQRQLAQSTRHRGQLAVVLLDLDDLKGVNDSGGHAAGDRLLRDAAAAWTASLREGDVLARIGGDEFGLLLPDCSGRDEAGEIVRRVHAAAGDVSASVGVAIWGGEAADAVLARADGALYRAKQGGRNQVVFADDLVLPTPSRPMDDAPTQGAQPA